MKRKCDEMREKVLDYAQLCIYFSHNKGQQPEKMSGNKTKKQKEK